MVSLLPTKTLTIDGDTRLGQSGVPALLWLPVVQGLLPFNFLFLVMGRGSTQEPPSRFYNFLHCCRNLSRWERFGAVSTSNSFHLALAMAMVALWYFLGSFHRPIPVRYNWNAFARKMHSTSKFAMIVLSKCVIHAGFVMVAWTLRGIPFQVGKLNLRPDL